MDGRADTCAVLAIGAEAPNDPSMRVRVGIPSAALAERGVLVRRATLFTDEQAARFRRAEARDRAGMLLRSRRRFAGRIAAEPASTRVALVQREADLLPFVSLERRAARGRRLVYDVDDAIWLTGRRSGGHPLGRIKGTARKMRWIASHADHVIAGNETVAEWLAPFARNIDVVPSLVDTAAITPRVHEDRDRFVVGWIGSPTTARYLKLVAPALRELVAQASGRTVEFLLVGTGPGFRPDVDARLVPWTPENEQRALAEMDVGIMPLPQTPWAAGKGSYKAIQYMAAGIPVIADDVGHAASVVGPAGHVVPREQWTEALLSLTGVAERRRLGAAGRQRAERDFSVARWAPRIEAILRGPV